MTELLRYEAPAADQHDASTLGEARRQPVGECNGGVDMDAPEQFVRVKIERSEPAATHDARRMHQRGDVACRVDRIKPNVPQALPK